MLETVHKNSFYHAVVIGTNGRYKELARASLYFNDMYVCRCSNHRFYCPWGYKRLTELLRKLSLFLTISSPQHTYKD